MELDVAQDGLERGDDYGAASILSGTEVQCTTLAEGWG